MKSSQRFHRFEPIEGVPLRLVGEGTVVGALPFLSSLLVEMAFPKRRRLLETDSWRMMNQDDDGEDARLPKT